MGSGGVAIAALPTVICLKVPFSDGLGGGEYNFICPFVNEENIQNSSALLDSAIVWRVALGNVRSLWRGTL